MTDDVPRRDRAHPLRNASLAGAALLLAGCTYLISFDAPPVGDAGTDLDAGNASSDAALEDAEGADAGLDAQPDSNACDGLVDGQYCGNNQLIDYPGSKDDLVYCQGSAVAQVRVCENGTGCIRMPNPKPDECDECADKDDGQYCGRDMAGWSTKNANMYVLCQGHGTSIVQPCSNCVSEGNMSKCW